MPSQEQKVLIEQDILNDFDDAREAILALPKTSRVGVYLAYKYYMKLFKKIRNAPAEEILKQRFRVPDTEKMYVLANTFCRNMIGAL